MDRGMGKNTNQQVSKSASQRVSGSASQPASGSAGQSGGGLRAPAARPYGRLETTGPAQTRPATPDQPKKQIYEGYVKNGVVHLLEGELPDGIFVKIVRE